MKNLRLLFLLAPLALALALTLPGCSSSDDPPADPVYNMTMKTPASGKIEVPYEGRDVTIEVETNVPLADMTVDILPDWITEKSSNLTSGVIKYVFTVAANTEDDAEERSHKLEFSGRGKKVDATINQGVIGAIPYLKITAPKPPAFYLDAIASTGTTQPFTLSLDTNLPEEGIFFVPALPAWINSVSKVPTSTGFDFNFSATNNTTGQTRNIEITLSDAANAQVTFTVSQEAESTPAMEIVTESVDEIATGGGSFDVDILTNWMNPDKVEVTLPEWITQTKVVANESKTGFKYTFQAVANNSFNTRSFEIEFKAGDDATASIEVTQNKITAPPSSYVLAEVNDATIDPTFQEKYYEFISYDPEKYTPKTTLLYDNYTYSGASASGNPSGSAGQFHWDYTLDLPLTITFNFKNASDIDLVWFYPGHYMMWTTPYNSCATKATIRLYAGSTVAFEKEDIEIPAAEVGASFDTAFFGHPIELGEKVSGVTKAEFIITESTTNAYSVTSVNEIKYFALPAAE